MNQDCVIFVMILLCKTVVICMQRLFASRIIHPDLTIIGMKMERYVIFFVSVVWLLLTESIKKPYLVTNKYLILHPIRFYSGENECNHY